MNKKKKKVVDGLEAPDRNEEYLLYQTLVGAWPVEPPEGGAYDAFARRIKDYMLKASREAKVNTSWINPDAVYEDAMLAFIDAVMRPSPGNAFLQVFLPFQRMVSHYGMYNSLSQTLLKICSPGVPDLYQGTELWDFSLVDPDNRRPVDYEQRMRLLADLREREKAKPAVEHAWDLSLSKEDGRIKLYLVYKALNFRKENREVFERGEYKPLGADGDRAEHVCAFERRWNSTSVVAVVPRFLTRLITGNGSVPFGKAVWGDACLLLLEAASGTQYRNIFTGEIVAAQQSTKPLLMLADVFSCFPAALFEQIS